MYLSDKVTFGSVEFCVDNVKYFVFENVLEIIVWPKLANTLFIQGMWCIVISYKH
jgi:hypothetical protein